MRGPATGPATGLAVRPLTAIALVVAVGGAAGAVARWWLGQLWPDGAGFPWTTLAINVSGSGLLAALPAVAAVRRRPLLPPLLGTGVLGGYTTLSSCAEQGRALAASGREVLAAAYVAASLLGCVLTVLVVRRLTHGAGLLQFEAEAGDE